jgi:hypothetical protein
MWLSEATYFNFICVYIDFLTHHVVQHRRTEQKDSV